MPLCPVPESQAVWGCWLGWPGWGAGAGPSDPLTRLFFQMIESNDISGEKVRMKETIEGEWPRGWVGPWAFRLMKCWALS